MKEVNDKIKELLNDDDVEKDSIKVYEIKKVWDVKVSQNISLKKEKFAKEKTKTKKGPRKK